MEELGVVSSSLKGDLLVGNVGGAMGHGWREVGLPLDGVDRGPSGVVLPCFYERIELNKDELR